MGIGCWVGDAEDVRWLAGPILERDDPWDGEVRYASSYFDAIYDVAEHLITKGKAYVDSLSAEEIREVCWLSLSLPPPSRPPPSAPAPHVATGSTGWQPHALVEQCKQCGQPLLSLLLQHRAAAWPSSMASDCTGEID